MSSAVEASSDCRADINLQTVHIIEPSLDTGTLSLFAQLLKLEFEAHRVIIGTKLGHDLVLPRDPGYPHGGRPYTEQSWNTPS